MVGWRVLNDFVKNTEEINGVQIGNNIHWITLKKTKKDISENILCPGRDFNVGHS